MSDCGARALQRQVRYETMNASAQQVVWQVVGSPAILAGFAYGCRYPSLLVRVAGPGLSGELRAELTRVVRDVAPSLDLPVSEGLAQIGISDPWPASIAWLLAAIHHVQRAAGLPIYEHGRILAATAEDATCIFPILPRGIPAQKALLQSLLNLMQRAAQGEAIHEHSLELGNAWNQLQASGPSGSNVASFVRAAFDVGFPFEELPGEVFQYGLGKRGCWLASSMTETTPNVSAWLAREKQLAALALRRAGLPVPNHDLATDEAQAIRIAERLGYPVVVKPSDLDGGLGVHPGLESAQEVRAAYQKARVHSPNILVEKHIPGKDYRLTVFQGETIWAVERVPGGVTGDGRRNVQELLDELNADPGRSEGKHTPRRKLKLDEEALLLLERSGLLLSSVPAAGRFVRLRRAANINSGGTPVAVFEEMHPDNRDFAERAAAALRLDFAGVDVLMPDIRRSWRETGAAICDINAQPNLGQTTATHLYAPILRKLVPGDGRIPTIVVIGAALQSQLIRALEASLLAKGLVVGAHDIDGVRVNRRIIMEGQVTPFVAGNALTSNRSVGAIVISIHDPSILGTGLPFARYDVCVLAGPNVQLPEEMTAANRQQFWRELLAAILPGCDGRVMMLEGSGLHVQGLERSSPARWDATPTPPNKLIDSIASEVLACEAKHLRGPT